MKIDETDHQLLRLLQEDARRSLRELSRRTGVSTPTVAAKVRRLEELGVIRGYRAALDPARLGRSGHVVDVEARPADARRLAKRLLAEPGVEDLVELAGGRIHVRIFASGTAGLQAFLDKLAGMPGVQAYTLHHVLAHRSAAPADPGDAIDVRCHECKGPIHGAGIRKAFAEEKRARTHYFCCRHCAASFHKRLAALARKKA